MTKRTLLLSAAAGLLDQRRERIGGHLYAVVRFDERSQDLVRPRTSRPPLSAVRTPSSWCPTTEDYAHAKPTKLQLPFHIEAEVNNSKWRIKDSRIVIGVAPLHSAGQVEHLLRIAV